MGRGIARVAPTTKKCSCDNPRITSNHIQVNNNTNEISYYLSCINCNAYWSTKSLSAREYWSDSYHKIPTMWGGYSYSGEKTVLELFREIDKSRLEYLMNVESIALENLKNAQKELEKSKAKVKKFKDEFNL